MEKNFGTRVRQARHKAGLTQAALAEKLNLDETTISRIENGSQATSFATMLNFSEALDVKFDYLISRENDITADFPVGHLNMVLSAYIL